jgi:hypothetical protein
MHLEIFAEGKYGFKKIGQRTGAALAGSGYYRSLFQVSALPAASVPIEISPEMGLNFIGSAFDANGPAI